MAGEEESDCLHAANSHNPGVFPSGGAKPMHGFGPFAVPAAARRAGDCRPPLVPGVKPAMAFPVPTPGALARSGPTAGNRICPCTRRPGYDKLTRVGLSG